MLKNNDVLRKLPVTELNDRLANFRKAMNSAYPEWDMFITNYKITQFYFTGTMVDGVLIIRPQEATLWVRKSYTRALEESNFEDIRSMRSLREAAGSYSLTSPTIYMEKKKATLDWQDFVHKYFPFENVVGVDGILEEIRSVKSEYELEKLRASGKLHEEALDMMVGSFIKAGISETELATKVYSYMLERGAQGVCRFNHPLGDEPLGICDFGQSGLKPQSFDGPGGCAGTCIAMQGIGHASNKLVPNQLVYMDIPCGYDGYHTDKTTTYYYGDLSKDPFGEQILAAQDFCLRIEQAALEHLVVGETLENVYLKALEQVPNPYGEAFMGGEKFLGHSVGLVIDEPPAIAKGFKQVIQENMVFALEPKVMLPGAGMVGLENTYVVTKEGPKSLTGKSNKLIIVEE